MALGADFLPDVGSDVFGSGGPVAVGGVIPGMAGTITVIETTAGRTIYTVIKNGAGLYWTGTGDAFEVYNSAHWANYAVGLSEGPPKTYAAAFPAAITSADAYSLVSYYQAGGSPATTDAFAGWGDIQWDGTKEIVASSGGGGTGLQAKFTENWVPQNAPVPHGGVCDGVSVRNDCVIDYIDANGIPTRGVRVRAGIPFWMLISQVTATSDAITNSVTLLYLS